MSVQENRAEGRGGERTVVLSARERMKKRALGLLPMLFCTSLGSKKAGTGTSSVWGACRAISSLVDGRRKRGEEKQEEQSGQTRCVGARREGFPRIQRRRGILAAVLTSRKRGRTGERHRPTAEHHRAREAQSAGCHCYFPRPLHPESTPHQSRHHSKHARLGNRGQPNPPLGMTQNAWEGPWGGSCKFTVTLLTLDSQ